jgi:DnaJ family protein C protein 3
LLPQLASIDRAIHAVEQAERAQAAQDWPTALEALSTALLVGPNNIHLRQLRLLTYTHLQDPEGYIGDLARLSHLQPSSSSHSVKLAHFAYLVQADPTRALGYIKQALHFDPDSTPHRKVHKLIRTLDKQVTQARNFVEGGKYREALKVLLGTGTASSTTRSGLISSVQSAITESTHSTPGTTSTTPLIPPTFQPMQTSHLLLELYRFVLKSHLRLGLSNTSELDKYADLVLGLSGGQGDVDALTAKGEVASKKEDWEEAVRKFNEAFEKGGRSSQDVSWRWVDRLPGRGLSWLGLLRLFFLS